MALDKLIYKLISEQKNKKITQKSKDNSPHQIGKLIMKLEYFKKNGTGGETDKQNSRTEHRTCKQIQAYGET